MDSSREAPMRKKPCDIKAEVKLRNGYDMWWCRTHHQRAWARGGGPLVACASADLELPESSDVATIASAAYPGGVGIWGAVIPLFNSTNLPLTSGVHVHARLIVDGAKEIDETYAGIEIEGDDGKTVQISDTAARAYVATAIVHGSAIELACPRCGFLHIDKGWFAVNPHRKHQCNRCGRSFYASEPCIGSPVAAARGLLGSAPNLGQTRSTLTIELADLAKYATGGLQIWASNPAILWTVPRREQSGIHLHAYEANNSTPLLDETYGTVTLEGEVLDDHAVRLLMVQTKLGYLDRRVSTETCPHCQTVHFDDIVPWSIKPHLEHLCASCGATFTCAKRTVSNPVLALLPKIGALFPQVATPQVVSPAGPGLRGATFRRAQPPAQPDPGQVPPPCKKSQHRP
jgi:hypothetical protein